MSGTEQVPGGLPSLLQKVRRRFQDHFLSRGFGSVLFFIIYKSLRLVGKLKSTYRRKPSLALPVRISRLCVSCLLSHPLSYPYLSGLANTSFGCLTFAVVDREGLISPQ